MGEVGWPREETQLGGVGSVGRAPETEGEREKSP